MMRCEVLAIDDVAETPAGRFTECLRIEVTRPEQPPEVRTRIYAPNVGLVSEQVSWIDAKGDPLADHEAAQRPVSEADTWRYLLVSRTPPFGNR